MIHIGIVFVIVFLFFRFQELLYKHFWYKNLFVDAYYNSANAFEGQTVGFTETAVNGKLLPMPFIDVSYSQSINLTQLDQTGKVTYIGKSRNTIFANPGRGTVVRTSTLMCGKRGYYSITDASVSTSDLFLSQPFRRREVFKSCLSVYPREIEIDDMYIPYKKFSGDILARRFILPDPFEFSGIREYQPFDSFRQINFKAWAKTGELMSNVYGHTVSQEICIILNLENFPLYRNNHVHEQAIRLAAFFARYYIEQGIPTSFITNGIDCLTGKGSHVSDGLTAEHLREVYEILARIDLDSDTNSEPIKKSLPDKGSYGTGLVAILISNYYNNDIIEWFENSLNIDASVMWVLPCSPGKVEAPPHQDTIIWEVPDE